jgi:PAS domain S-box-containing protein
VKTGWAILILDKTDALISRVKAVLKKSGVKARLERAADMTALRRAVRSGGWDAVLAAHPLPGLKLGDAIRFVKTAAGDPPFIVIAAACTAATAVRVMRAGAHDCLGKNELSRLASVLRRELKSARTRRLARQADDAFAASERHYRVLFDSSSDPMLIYDFTGCILNANKIACIKLGYTQLELLKKNIVEIDRTAAPDALEKHLGQLQRLGQHVFETEFTRKHGDFFPVEVSARIIEFHGRKAVLSVARDTSERHEAEEALRRSEEKYRELVENLNDILYIITPEGTLTYISPVLETVTGYPAAEVLGRPFFGFIHPDDAERARANLQGILEGRAFTNEYRFRYRDGGYRWMSTSSRPMRVAGRIVGSQGILSDVSVRKRTEEALRVSEQQLSEAMKFAKLGHWDYDVLKDQFTFNDHFYAIFRTTAAAVGGYVMSAAEYSERFLHPEDQRLVAEETRQAILSNNPGYSRRVEHRIRYADGSIGYIAVLIYLVKDAAGKTVRTYGVNQDITERKKAEEALRLSEEKFRRLFQYSAAGIVLVDTDHRFLTANDAFCRMLGYGESELLERTFQDVTHPDDRPVGSDLVRQTIAGERDAFQLEKRYLRRDGGVIWGLLIATLIRGPHGRPMYFVAQVQDITARKEAERALRESEIRYRELFEHINTGVAVYEAVDEGRDFIIRDFNRAGEKIDHDDRRRLIGKSIFTVRPELETQGLLAVFRRVWKTGEAASCPVRRYANNRIAGWHENFVYKLPSGEIVVVFEDVTPRQRAEEDLHWELTVQNALTALYTPIISPASTMQDIARVMLERARELTGSGHGFVSLIDPATDAHLLFASTDSSTEGQDRPGAALRRSAGGTWLGLRGHALTTKAAFFTNEPAVHPAMSSMPAGHFTVERFLSAPVNLHGETVGQIALANPGRDFSERDLAAVVRLAEFFALAVQNKRAEDKVKASLREKVLMLKEIHHRIKNNLQVVMSLLNLQAHHLADAGARSLFRENQFRIKSMALIHERLYQSTDLSHVDFKEYITKLAIDLFHAYRIDVDTIRFTVQADDISLGIDTSVPCGLIINELLLNSLKHAFSDGRRGMVTVTLVRSGRDDLLLTVRDDGVGLPPEFDIRESKSLGFNLVVALTEQLGGSIRVHREDPGTRIEIALKIKD